MTRTSTQFYIDRQVDLGVLSASVARALGVPHESVVSANLDDRTNVVPHWFSNFGFAVGVQTRTIHGDFPLEIVVMAHEDLNYKAMIHDLARTLDAAILTDEFDGDGLSAIEWMLVTPDGEASMVFTDDGETNADTITLDPESHQIYDARMAHAAAD